MSDYTPGPWVVVEHSWSRIGIYAVNRGIAALDIYDEASEETQAECEAVMLANAHLIAAAPDMLSALRRAVLALAFAAESSAAMQDDYKAVSAAIAKATGSPT